MSETKNKRTQTIPQDAVLVPPSFATDEDSYAKDDDVDEFIELSVTSSHHLFLQQLKKLEKKDPVEIPDEVLVKRVNEGDTQASLWILVRHYKYIIRKILDITGAHWYTDDIISAGTLGLYEAAKRYDASKGVKFLTYAHYWILKLLYMEIRNEVLPMGGIGIGRDAKERAYNYLKYHMSGMSDAEICEKLGLTPKALTELKLLSISCLRVKSLDATESYNDDDDDIDPYSKAGVPSKPSAESEYLSQDFIRYLERQVNFLREHEQPELATFLEYELGLNGKCQLEKADLCKEMGITRKEYEQARREGNKFLRVQMISDGWYDAKNTEIGELLTCYEKELESQKH